MNPEGQYVDYTLGNGVHTIKKYTPYDMLQSISATGYESMTLDFDPTNGNLLDRTEGSLLESFTYDPSLNSRLWDAHSDYPTTSTITDLAMNYDLDGNIVSKSDICEPSTAYSNGNSNNQVTSVPNSYDSINPGQSVTYTSFNAPLSISISGYSLAFTYGPDNNREQTVLTDAYSNTVTRTFGNAYEKTVYSDGTPTTEVNYVNCGGDLVAMDVKQGSVDTIDYVYTDHLGSILTVANASATYNQSFDVWGNYRNPTDGSYNSIPTVPLWLYRGFTGHEHLPQFQLINANGRLYDPLEGSMLSPDITVQSPTNTQNFNRYSYCMNNPLKYSDPSGFMWSGASSGAGWDPDADDPGGPNGWCGTNPWFKGGPMGNDMGEASYLDYMSEYGMDEYDLFVDASVGANTFTGVTIPVADVEEDGEDVTSNQVDGNNPGGGVGPTTTPLINPLPLFGSDAEATNNIQQQAAIFSSTDGDNTPALNGVDGNSVSAGANFNGTVDDPWTDYITAPTSDQMNAVMGASDQAGVNLNVEGSTETSIPLPMGTVTLRTTITISNDNSDGPAITFNGEDISPYGWQHGLNSVSFPASGWGYESTLQTSNYNSMSYGFSSEGASWSNAMLNGNMTITNSTILTPTGWGG
jgi:RHS repeat-associated protein